MSSKSMHSFLVIQYRETSIRLFPGPFFYDLSLKCDIIYSFLILKEVKRYKRNVQIFFYKQAPGNIR